MLQKGEVLYFELSRLDYSSNCKVRIESNCKTIKSFYYGYYYGYDFFPVFTHFARYTVKDELFKSYANSRLYKKDIAAIFTSLAGSTTTFYNGIDIQNSGVSYLPPPFSLGNRVFNPNATSQPAVANAEYGFFRHFPAVRWWNSAIYTLGYNPSYSGGTSWVSGWDCDKYDNLKDPPPTNYFVRSCWIPTSTNEMPDDTNYADLLIYVHEDGLHSTTLNGQPIPASAFDSFPYTNREYWVAQFAYYNQDIPPYFKIENPHGFHADLDEIAYHARPSDPSKIDVTGFLLSSSGEAYEDLDFAHNNLSPHDSATVYRCVGDTLLLDANTQWDSIPCLWTLDGTDYPDMPVVAVPLLDTGLRVARLILYGNPNCPDTTTTFVRVLPPPVLPLHSDTTLCRGTELSAWDGNAILYHWSNGATTPSITIDTAGMYSVTVTNRGCTAHSDSVRVDLFPQSSVDFGADTALCSIATLILDAGQPHPATYLWHDGSTNRTYTVYQDGTYWVVVTDHCTGVSDTIAVEYLEDFDIELGNDTTLCTGAELRLSAYVPGAEYRWQDGSAQPDYVVRHAGEYSVSVRNACFSHGDRIYVSYGDCEQEVRMPTAFTPNGDGLNDRLLPVFEHPEQVQSFRMVVYDRWGGVVFVTRDPNEGWDGSGAPAGVYVVHIRHTDLDGTEHDVRTAVTLVK